MHANVPRQLNEIVLGGIRPPANCVNPLPFYLAMLADNFCIIPRLALSILSTFAALVTAGTVTGTGTNILWNPHSYSSTHRNNIGGKARTRYHESTLTALNLATHVHRFLLPRLSMLLLLMSGERLSRRWPPGMSLCSNDEFHRHHFDRIGINHHLNT